MNDRYSLPQIQKLDLPLIPGDKVFLYGDLGSGKTTLTASILKSRFAVRESVTSPTYVHYRKYGDHIYHFDLYRLESYDDFVNIGGEEILDDPKNISLIEWPEILEGFYEPEYAIRLSKVEGEEGQRLLSIRKKD